MIPTVFVLDAFASGFASAKALISSKTSDQYLGAISLVETSVQTSAVRIVKGAIATADRLGTILDPTNRGTAGHVLLDEFVDLADIRFRGYALAQLGPRRVVYVRPLNRYTSTDTVSAYGSGTGLTYGDAYAGIQTYIDQGRQQAFQSSAVSVFFPGFHVHENGGQNDADYPWGGIGYNRTRSIGATASSSDFGWSTLVDNRFEFRGDLPYESGQIMGISLMASGAGGGDGHAWSAAAGNSWNTRDFGGNAGTPIKLWTRDASAWGDPDILGSALRMTSLGSVAFNSAISTTSNAFFASAYSNIDVIMPDQGSASNRVYTRDGFKFSNNTSAAGVRENVRWKNLILAYGDTISEGVASASVEGCHLRSGYDTHAIGSRINLGVSGPTMNVHVTGCEIEFFQDGGVYPAAQTSGGVPYGNVWVRYCNIHDIGELDSTSDGHAIGFQSGAGAIIAEGCSIARTGGAIHQYYQEQTDAGAAAPQIIDCFISGKSAMFTGGDSDSSDNGIQFGGDAAFDFERSQNAIVRNTKIRGFRNGIRTKWTGEIAVCGCDIRDVDYGLDMQIASVQALGGQTCGHYRVFDSTIQASVAFSYLSTNSANQLGVNHQNNTIIASANQVVITGVSGSTFSTWQGLTPSAELSAVVTLNPGTGSTRQDPA